MMDVEVDSVKEAKKRWAKANPEKVAASRRRWYLKHREEQLARVKANRLKKQRAAAEATSNPPAGGAEGR